MKKLYFALAVAAAALLVSCVKEQSFDDITPVPEGSVAFAIQDVSTRSGAVVSNLEKGLTISLGKTEDGEAFYLEETIEELNPSLTTKGSPAYTQNVGKLYTTMGVYADGDFGQANFDVMDYYDRKVASEGRNLPHRRVAVGRLLVMRETTMDGR